MSISFRKALFLYPFYLEKRFQKSGLEARWRLGKKYSDFERNSGKHYYGFTTIKISN